MSFGTAEASDPSHSSRGTRMVPRWVVAVALLVAATVVGRSETQAQADCKAPKELVQLSLPLNRAYAGISREADVRIVALGSSSTQGAGASNPRMCYPARLEEALNRSFAPDRYFEVFNLGVGGQMATDMRARIETKVLPLKPHLVIWQTGVNDAIAGVPLRDFRAAMSSGIDAIKAAGSDVILIDMQYYPRSATVPRYNEYLVAMRQIAHEKDVPIQSRYAIMKHLVDSAQFTPAQLLAEDQFHLNDVAYGCMGNLLAQAIGDGLGRAAARRMSGGPASTQVK